MVAIENTLDCFNQYLQGGSIEQLKRHMDEYDGKRQSVRDNFHTIPISNNAIKNRINTLLKALFIPSDQINNYLSSDLTVFDLLLDLHRNNIAGIQTDYLIELINKKSRWRKRDFFLIGALLSVILGVMAMIPSFSAIIVALYGLLTSPRALPIVGLVYSLSVTAYMIFSHQFDRKIPLYDRIRNNFFVIASMVLNIIAYSLWISSPIGITYVVAGLFVSSAFMHVIKEGVALLKELIINYRNQHVYAGENSIEINVDYVRHEFSFKKHRNAALINLVTAIALAGVMTAWHFIPGGFLLSAIAVLSIGIIYGTQMLLKQKNDAVIRENLQKELALIKEIPKESQKQPELVSSPITRHVKSVPRSSSPNPNFFQNTSDSNSPSVNGQQFYSETRPK